MAGWRAHRLGAQEMLMGTTERVLTGVIIAGLAGCLGLFAMRMGPREAQASPVGTPGLETSGLEPELSVAEEAPMNDPLTAAVEGADARRAQVALSRSFTLEPGSFTTAFTPGENGDGAAEVREVLLSRLVTLGGLPVFAADFDGDEQLNESDMGAFEESWAQGDARADLNGDGTVDAADFADFLAAYESQEKKPGSGGSVIQLQLGGTGEQEIQLGGGGGTVTFQLQLTTPTGGNP